MPASRDVRRGEDGGVIDVVLLRGFARAALNHQTAQDQSTISSSTHIVTGRYHPSVVAASRKRLRADLLDAMTVEDWQSVADQLIADTRAALEHTPAETQAPGG